MKNRVVLLIFKVYFMVAAPARCSAPARSTRSTFFCAVACSSDTACASVRINRLHSATCSPCRERYQCLHVRVDARHRDATGGHLRACRLPTCRELSNCFTALRARRDASVRTARRCIAELHFIGRVRRTPLNYAARSPRGHAQWTAELRCCAPTPSLAWWRRPRLR